MAVRASVSLARVVRRMRARLPLLVLLVAGAARVSGASCAPSPAIDAARAEVAAACGCDTAPNHGTYLHCVRDVLRSLALPGDCYGGLMKCAARSTCGRSGAVACCRTSASGRNACSIKPSADKCRPPQGGSACASAFESCCDACVAGGCATTTTTTIP
jgi:hypothetical protein